MTDPHCRTAQLSQNLSQMKMASADGQPGPIGHHFLEQSLPFNNSFGTSALWFPQGVSYFVPSFSLAQTISAPSTPSLSNQETPPNWNSEAWLMPYFNSFPQAPLLAKTEDVPHSPNQAQPLVKQEQAQLKYETSTPIPTPIQIKPSISSPSPTQKRSRKKQSDRDYVPHRSQKKQPKKRLHQNQNRNVIPNQINQIVSFLQKRSKSGHLLQRIWLKFAAEDESYSLSRFYLYQSILKDRSGFYSNQGNLRLLSQLYEPECRIWPLHQQRHYITLSRMLVGHFLREDSIPIILTSKRMKSQKKLEHLRARRQITKRVIALIRPR